MTEWLLVVGPIQQNELEQMAELVHKSVRLKSLMEKDDDKVDRRQVYHPCLLSFSTGFEQFNTFANSYSSSQLLSAIQRNQPSRSQGENLTCMLEQIRDDVNWESIASTLGTRSHSVWCRAW